MSIVKQHHKLVIIFMMSLLLGCANAKPLTVILDWFVNPDHAPLFVAQQQGYFKKQGIKVTFIAPSQATDGPKLVATGKADIAITYQPQFTMQLAQGLPLMRIGALTKQPLDCMMVLQQGNIKSLKDLKGKRIAYTAGVSSIILQTMLATAKLTLKDVKLIAVNQGIVQALLSGQVDAVMGAMRNFEPIEMRLAGKPARLFFPEKYGVPNYEELILVANQAEQSDLRIAKFLRAWQQGVQYLRKHPTKSWQLFAKNHPELNNMLNRQAWFATLPYFASHPATVNKKSYRQWAIFLKNRGLIKTMPHFVWYHSKPLAQLGERK